MIFELYFEEPIPTCAVRVDEITKQCWCLCHGYDHSELIKINKDTKEYRVVSKRGIK